MKHSTGTPTKAERQRMAAIKACRCVACIQLGIDTPFPEVHHLLSGNVRRGHRYTVGLCAWHHRGVYAGSKASFVARFGPSLADGSKPFRVMFGSDDQLLERQDRMIELERRLRVGYIPPEVAA